MNVPAIMVAIEFLESNGAIERDQNKPDRYITTPKGAAWIAALGAVPAPHGVILGKGGA